MNSEEKILYHFLKGEGNDIYGRSLDKILGWNDIMLELNHNYIQWVFPIDTLSKYAESVALSKEMIEILSKDNTVIANIRKSFFRMMTHYGFSVNENDKLEMTDFSSKIAKTTWLKEGNHNLLRMTRILRCLHLLGMEKEETMLFEALQKLMFYNPFLSDSYSYWVRATERIN